MNDRIVEIAEDSGGGYLVYWKDSAGTMRTSRFIEPKNKYRVLAAAQAGHSMKDAQFAYKWLLGKDYAGAARPMKTVYDRAITPYESVRATPTSALQTPPPPPKQIAAVCEYNNYPLKPGSPLPARHSHLPLTHPRNEVGLREVRQFVARSYREWPTCHVSRKPVDIVLHPAGRKGEKLGEYFAPAFHCKDCQR